MSIQRQESPVRTATDSAPGPSVLTPPGVARCWALCPVGPGAEGKQIPVRGVGPELRGISRRRRDLRWWCRVALGLGLGDGI
jgi:hypothetical protein